MTDNNKTSLDFSLAYYMSDRKTGSISVVSRQGGETSIRKLEQLPESGLEKLLKPVFVGLTEDQQVITLDARTKELSIQSGLIADAFPAHIYSDPNADRDWYMNDGDKATGNDTLNCGDNGSSVTVVENTSSQRVNYLKTICVGRGHHQCNFAYPSDAAPDVPHTAYVSNLNDGTLTAVGNDPADADTYLKPVATINLCEPDKEGDAVEGGIPNKSFPHGLVYSKATGKVYNLNNGYGTIAVIDPKTQSIEARVPFKGFSNLFISPCGHYIFGRGADRKSDPDHVIAKLAVLDAKTCEVLDRVDLRDTYISKYFFNPEGSKLYLTTSSSGSDEQKANLKTDALLAFDLTALPKIQQVKGVRLGAPIGTVDFLAPEGKTELIFTSNSAKGVVSILCGESDEVIETISVGDCSPHSRLWLL